MRGKGAARTEGEEDRDGGGVELRHHLLEGLVPAGGGLAEGEEVGEGRGARALGGGDVHARAPEVAHLADRRTRGGWLGVGGLGGVRGGGRACGGGGREGGRGAQGLGERRGLLERRRRGPGAGASAFCWTEPWGSGEAAAASKISRRTFMFSSARHSNVPWGPWGGGEGVRGEGREIRGV